MLILLAAPQAALADPEREYQAEGAAVEGGSSIAGAPTVTPGVHLDSFETGSAEVYEDGTVKYYRVDLEEGERIHGAATIDAPAYSEGLPEERSALEVALGFVTAGGEDCNDDSSDTVGETGTGDGPITTSRVSGVLGPEECAGDALFLQVIRKGPRAQETALPVEIQIAIEPAGLEGGEPAVSEPVEDEGASPVAPESSEALDPGRSFLGATPVEPGSVILDLVPGESAMLAIDVAEGQRLRWRTEVTAAPDEDPGDLSLRAYDPVRGQVAVGGGRWGITPSATIQGGGMAAPVDLGNRSSDDRSIASTWLPGRHYVQVQRLQRDRDDEPSGSAPVRLILTLEVAGEPLADAAETPVLEMGETASTLGGEISWGRIAKLLGAGVLGLTGLVTGVAGAVVLRRRR